MFSTTTVDMSSSDSDSNAVAPGGIWLSSLIVSQAEDLFKLCMYVPSVEKLPRSWSICDNRFATISPPETNEELCRHPGSRYNRKGCRHFWRGKNLDEVVGAFRRTA
ncbi:hypothetical protein D1007_02130 [Hordeum vulgare]|nr:hypothetical protein D1007_02130 [Hordeum vulgare]KAI4966261.1 hypothetical protein ZWY2020_041877 [Hordeum vulgare]KAI4992202.1 hypothetical protein ZWY2020_046694 [Hordeum vulgare]